ncbi:restriction endonuclease subunit S [Helicobacter pylori]|nr:restriction endonuclease subunit S [Helicobacter pylori]
MDALTTPSNWQKVRLGDIAEIKRGASPRPIENPKWFCTNSNVGWVRISDISKNSRFLYKTAQKLSKKGIEKSRFVKQNSLIMSMCATIGKPIITKIDTCIHDGFVVFENPKIDLNYLYYFLCYIEKEWLESGQQDSQVNLNVDLIKNKEVFCPKDLNEQAAIANVLSDLDRYLCSLDALILKKESVKKALSFELLSQRKRLKGFNQAWQRVRLGDILSYEQPTKYLVATTQYLQKGFTPILTAGKTFILGYTNDKHGIYTNIPVIIFDDFTTDSKMVSFPFKVKSSAIKILSLRDNNQADLKYIYEKLTLLKHQVTDHKRYWIDEFSNFEIPLPSLNEQIAIANILSALDSEIISLKNKKRQFENIKKALNHDLMSAKIRVLNK